MPRKTLYLIDGHAQIYRCYYAPFRPLTAPSGEPTKATYGFCQLLLNLLRDKRPDYLAMVMDVSDETVFRVHIDPTYKAHREPPPEDLEPQKERIVAILDALGVPVLRMAGWEADDIFATLCARLGGGDLDIYLVSKDKDLDQLLGDTVRMYDPAKDTVVDAAAMQAEKGYPPAKAVEAQVLMGDSVDNVVGVYGVGPKKAAELLTKYGDVAGVIANADKLTPKLAEAVRAFAKRADVVRQLITLRSDVPIEFDLQDAAVSRFRADAALRMFREIGFNRLTEQLDGVIGNLAPGSAGGSHDESKDLERAGPYSAPATGDAAIGGLFDQAERAVADVPAGQNESQARFARGDYQLVDDEATLAALAARLQGIKEFAFDTETTSLVPVDADLVGISISWEAGKAYYIAVRGVGKTVPFHAVQLHLGPIFADAGVAKCGQNLKYDLGVLLAAGMPVAGVRFDTMIASFVLDSARRSHGIDALALDLLGIRKIATSELIGKGKEQIRFDQIDTSRTCVYACEDADVAWRLKELFEPQLLEAGLEKLFYELEMPLVEVLALMEHHGVALDTDLLARISNDMAERMRQLTHDIHEAAGRPFNIDSTKQLAEVLFDKLKLPVVRRTKTGRSTDAEVLAELATKSVSPAPKLVLEYRELAKLKGTYVDALPEMVSSRTGRVHCSFHQTGAVTGRLSSSDPNLQNIPIRTEAGAQIRRAFVPKPVGSAVRTIDAGHSSLQSAIRNPQSAIAADAEWVLISADYSQIELRVLAHFCGDENLRQAFAEDRDIHAFVAAQVFNVPLDQVTKEQRGRAKTVNFGIIYGQTAFGLSRQTGMSQGDARVFIEAYFQRYPRIREFLDRIIKQARKTGFVETLLGRRRRIDDIDSRNPQARSAAERFAVNTVVQGTAADIIKRAMANIHRRLRDERRPSRLLIQVHDELVFETPKTALFEEARMIRDEMSGAIPLSVPVKVDVAAGENWLDVEDVAME